MPKKKNSSTIMIGRVSDWEAIIKKEKTQRAQEEADEEAKKEL